MPRKVPKNRKQHRISQDTGMEEKHCGQCNTWKPLEAYNKRKASWDNLSARCKACSSASHKKWHRELYATEEGRERIKTKSRKSEKKRRMNGKVRVYQRAYQRAYYRKRRNDPTYRLRLNISTSINNGLRRQGIKRKPGRTIEFIGCSYAHLMDHLESLFQPGMTRENYGKIWHVDHIVPRAAFGGTREELMIVNWFKNLQPMWPTENIIKNGKYKKEDKIALIERYNKEHNTNYMQECLKDYYQKIG